MRRSSTTIIALLLGWLLGTGLSALVLLSAHGTFWIAAHDGRFARTVWPLLGIVLVSGVALLLAVHAYVQTLLGDAIVE